MGAGALDFQCDREIGRRQMPRAPFWPLDEPENARSRPLSQAEHLELRRDRNTIQIEMEDAERRRLMQLEQRVGRTANRTRDAAAANEAARQGRLSGTQLTDEIQHDQG